jgi:hypothetical protein
MKISTCLGAGFALLTVLIPAVAHAAKVTADILPPLRRQVTVDTAERLANRKAPGPVPEDVPSPYNPVDFDKQDPAEIAAAGGGRPGTTPAGGGTRPTGPATAGQSAPAQPPPPPGDRETLETLAAQITPSAMLEFRGKPLLVIGVNRFEVGTRFTAAYNGKEYEIELVAIDRTTFTLRYHSEEITRPIKPVR